MEKKEKKGSIFDSTIEAFQSFLRVPNTVTSSVSITSATSTISPQEVT